MAIRNIVPIRKIAPWKWAKRDLPTMLGEEHPFYSLQHEVNRLFDDFFRGFSLAPFREFGRVMEDRLGTYSPRLNITESENEAVLTAELPGMDEKDFEISLSKNLLTIKGEKRMEKEEKGSDFYKMERSYGSFHRAIPLPWEVDEEKVEASFQKGVLTIKLPKTALAKKEVKKITVKAA